MPIRILHVITGMGSGGAEMMIMNWYRNIDRTKIQFDFLLRSSENIYEEEINRLGGRVFYTAEYPKHYFKNKRQTKQFFKEHASEYHAIHVHCNALLYVNIFDIAKKYNIKTRIIHSHNTHTKNMLFELVHKFNRKRVDKIATHFLACSKESGEWAAYKKREFQIIFNGIDVERFAFNQANRDDIRKKLNIEGKYVIGNVARFLPAKNHKFLIEVFKGLVKRDDTAVLILIGTGVLEDEIKDEVANAGIKDKVLFLGVKKDIEKYFSAMDIFALPSKFEGFGIVLAEAQVNGLRAFASDKIPSQAKMSNLVEFLPITDANLWAERIIQEKDLQYQRGEFYNRLKGSEMDIKSVIAEVEKIYGVS